ncbi:hypothetical protein, partial [Brachybacterium sp.]|uniref:hypothetical protein n=1 Tax=Brachybacterium sp. TaxID=1891286 RepID=UPI003F99680E
LSTFSGVVLTRGNEVCTEPFSGADRGIICAENCALSAGHVVPARGAKVKLREQGQWVAGDLDSGDRSSTRVVFPQLYPHLLMTLG